MLFLEVAHLMNEIRNSGINSYSSMGLGQIQQTQIAQQSTSSSATSMGQMLDKTLGAPASGGYLAPEQSLSLDAVTSGTVGGYLGLGNEASGSLDAPSPSNMIAVAPENNVLIQFKFHIYQCQKKKNVFHLFKFHMFLSQKEKRDWL